MAWCARVRVVRAARALLATTAVTAFAAVVLGVPGAASVRVDAAPTPTVRLLHVSPVVHRAGQPVAIVLTRSGAAAIAGSTVQVTLYTRLTTRSGLLAAVGSPGPSGPVTTSGPLPASCLQAGGVLAVALRVAPDGVAVPHRTLCGRITPVLRLGCSAGCDGVYPLRIAVHGGGISTTIDTLITYAAVAAANPLELAWVIRVAGPASALAGARGALQGVAAHPTVPVTVDVQGQTVASPSAAAAPAVALLRAATAAQAHELTAEAYVPADLGTLRASALPAEVPAQFALTASTLRVDGVRRPTARTVTIGSGPQTPTSADAVASLGFHHLVVDGSDLAVDPAETLHWGGAFRLGGAPQGPTALAADPGLSALSDVTADDPGLTAANFLGELALLHFEAPNLPDPRVVVAVTDASPAVAAAFVNEVLAGLQHNPVVTPVTVSHAFRTVPVGANGFPGVRDLATSTSGTYAGATVSEIRFLRITLDALASAVRGGLSPVGPIDGMLLSAEQPMSPSLRQRVFTSVHERLADQQAYFRIYDGAITLTQSGAALPITIFSSAPYTYTGFLVLTSPKLTFPDGPGCATSRPSRTCRVQLDGPVGGVYSVRISATADVTGDIPLTASLVSPDHNLQLAKPVVITVRATQTSIVGIALTVLAVLVLAVWWVRTSRRRRAAR